MKKLFSLILCVTLCICVCTACSKQGDNEGKSGDKATDTPAPTEAVTGTPEPTATAAVTATEAPTPTETEPTDTPTPTPDPVVDSYTAADFIGEWYMLSGEVDGYSSLAIEENNATKLIIGEDMKVTYDALLGGTDNRVNEVQCEFIPADTENCSSVYGEFSDADGYPESYTCYLLEDGNLELNNYFTYDMGTVPVNSQQIFTRDASVYNEIIDSVVLEAGFIGYGVGNISKSVYDSENDYVRLASASAPYIMFDEKNYWIDSKVADYLNEGFSSLGNESYARIEELIGKLSAEEKKEIADSNGRACYYLDTNLFAVRSDSAVFSGIVDLEGFLGGPHPDNSFSTVNYDNVNDREIGLDDFCKDKDKLYEVLVEKLTSKYPDAVFLEMESTLKEMIEEESLPFLIGYGGVDFYFSPISLAAYADGLLTVEIGYDEYEGLFKSRYSAIPYSYTVETMINLPYFFDVDGDGNREELILYVDTNDWGDYTRLRAFADGEIILDYELEEESYSLETFFMQNDNGCYLFAGITYSSDDDKVIGFKFNSDGQLEKTGSWLGHFDRFSGGVEDCWTGEEEWASMSILADSYDLVLIERNDILGTKYVIYNCRVNKDGVIETTSDRHQFVNYSESWNKVTTLRKIKAFKSDSAGSKGENVTISKGTELYPYASMGNNAVVFESVDGKEYYLVEFDNEYGSIGGKSNWELFDGLLFAD